MMIKIAGKTMNKRGYIALTILMTLIVGIVLSINFVQAEDVEEEQTVEDVIAEDVTVERAVLSREFEQIDVVVRNGDTAWDIQNELTPNENINKLIVQLEELNNMNLENLNPGDIVKFAIYR